MTEQVIEESSMMSNLKHLIDIGDIMLQKAWGGVGLGKGGGR